MLLPLFCSVSRRWPVCARNSFAASGPARFSLWSSVFIASLTLPLAFNNPIALDSPSSKHEPSREDSRVDPETSISFPVTIQVPSKQNYPPLTLLGVGVRTVSFLGLKVYSIGFYADMQNPNIKLTPSMSSQDKIEHIINTTACVVRIVPTRATSYTHLRDAFVRALQGRLALGKTNNTVSEQLALSVATPIRQLKTMFPNTPLHKHTPMDIFLTSPSPDQPRTLIIRDMGAVENDWVATQFFLHYFEGDGPSPPLKRGVIEALEH